MINRKILIVDDNHDIHEDFKKVLLPKPNLELNQSINDLESQILGTSNNQTPITQINASYTIDSAYQGTEGYEMVASANKRKDPYALVFMDVRMPPGTDGIQATKKILLDFPSTEVVLCTAYSDYSNDDIIRTLGVTHKLLLLKKPFDPAAVKLMALSLTTKWNLEKRVAQQVEDLEEAVNARTNDLEASRSRLQAILDNAKQGFFTFSENLKIEENYSRRAEEILEKSLSKKLVSDVINIHKDTLTKFVAMIFSNDLALLKTFSSFESNIGSKTVKIDFTPILIKEKLDRVLCTLTDITETKLLHLRTENAERINNIIVKILKGKSAFNNTLDSLKSVDFSIADSAYAQNLAHTLKGELGQFGFDDLSNRCDAFEDQATHSFSIEEFKSFIALLQGQLDDFINKHTNILKLKDAKNKLVVKSSSLKEIVKVAIQLKSPELWASVQNLLESSFEEYQEWLNDIWISTARKLGKEVHPIRWEKSAFILQDAYQPLLSSLIHAIRNSLAHGIELPSVRKAAEKDPKGVLNIKLEMIDDTYHFWIKDDGKGIDLNQISAKAAQLQIPVPTTAKDVIELLFHPSFTTELKANTIAGKGIGLKAIRAEAKSLGGGAAAILTTDHKSFDLHVWFKKVSLEDFFK